MDFVTSVFAPDRYSARKMVKPVNFVCVAPAARQVFLIGEFNGWDATANPMNRQPDGAWLLQLSLHHGHHQYRFVVDGKAVLDPRAHGITRDRSGEQASLLAIS